MKNVIHFVRRSAAALIAGLVVCSAHAVTVPSSCNPAAAAADGVTLLRTCSPEITFYVVATEDFNVNVTNSWLTTNMVKIFDVSKPIVTINLAGNTTANAFYGYGIAGTSFAGQRIAVIINGTNGYISGLRQLLTGLKSGSALNGVDGQEYRTIQLHTAADQKAGRSMPATDVTVTNASALRPLVTLSASRIADFKTGWGMDKQKVAHMAMSEFRPSEAPSGLLPTWSAKTFPAETFAMRGYGVIVNTNMYKALMARDVREGRIRDASCNSSDASVLLAKCQPTVFTHDYKSLMTAKATSAAVFLNDAQETRVLNLNRLPITSGAQTAAQISFADQANYLGKYPLAVGLDTAGAESATLINGVRTPTEEVYNPGFKVYTNHTGLDLLKNVNDDQQNLSIGVVGFWPLKTNYPNAHWVKLDGLSPNYYQGGTEDLSLRVGLQTGYPLAYEFQFIKSAKLAGSYLDIYNLIVAGFKDVANSSAPGIAYINSADATKNTPWTRGGNNLFGLNRTAAEGTRIPCIANCDGGGSGGGAGPAPARTIINVSVPENSLPWSFGANPNMIYNSENSGGAPISINLLTNNIKSGGLINIKCASGTGYLAYPPSSEIAVSCDGSTQLFESHSTFPSKYVPSFNQTTPFRANMLMGSFANSNGSVIGNPFMINSSGVSVSVPQGAAQLLIGVDDQWHPDNSGSRTVTITY